MTPWKFFWLLTGLCVLAASVLAACSPAAPRATSNPPELLPPAATATLPALPAATPQPEPTAASANLPSPTPPPGDGGACLPPGEPVPLPQLAFPAYAEAILDFLNTGASPQQLAAALDETGIANLPVAVMTGDLTGDGFGDLAVSIYDRQSANVPPAGALLIYICQAGQYALASNQPTAPSQGGPRLWYLQDLNADGNAEVVDSVASCGASTCFDTIRVWGWDGAAFTNRLDWPLDGGLPYADVQLSGPDVAGYYAIQITAAGLGSAGAGPQRAATWTFRFQADAGVWQSAGMELAASNFRIHVLQDADLAAQKGDYTQALLLYQRVLSDTTLQDWQNPAAEQANTAAYARFKLFAIYTLQGMTDFANIVLRELTNSVPQNAPQHIFVEMALAFQQGFAESGAAAACRAVQSLAEANPQTALTPFGPQVYGHATPELTPEQLCPWK